MTIINQHKILSNYGAFMLVNPDLVLYITLIKQESSQPLRRLSRNKIGLRHNKINYISDSAYYCYLHIFKIDISTILKTIK